MRNGVVVDVEYFLRLRANELHHHVGGIGLAQTLSEKGRIGEKLQERNSLLVTDQTFERRVAFPPPDLTHHHHALEELNVIVTVVTCSRVERRGGLRLTDPAKVSGRPAVQSLELGAVVLVGRRPFLTLRPSINF